MTEQPAKIYIRNNGAFGASCDGVADTGHLILEDSGRFTVHSVHADEQRICINVTRAAAEQAIAEDWRSA